MTRAVFERRSPALAAFDYLLAHAAAAAFEVTDSSHGKVRSVALYSDGNRRPQYSAIANAGHITFYILSGILSDHPGLFEAASAIFGPVRANSKGEYRLHLRSPADVDLLLDFLRREGGWPSRRHDRRFIRATFDPVSDRHLRRAAEKLAAGIPAHGFGPSTDYDLLFEGHRLPPKAVFGLAATEALGFPVRPENFTAGAGQACFRILRDNGYSIIPKGGDVDTDPVIGADEERTWNEGGLKLIAHLRRERASGLALEKKKHFRGQHGRLFCERCNMDPLEVYGEVGEACIEVHHCETRVADMENGHLTRIEELMCLCANCHRIAHRELDRERKSR